MSPRAIALAVASSPTLAGALAQNPSGAKLWPRGAELDFGALAAREEAFDTLWLANPTDEPFAVETVRSSCGCTAVTWPPEPLSPGEVVAIPVRFRCARGGGPVRRHLDVWLSHLRRAERVYAYADCRPRGRR